MRLIFLNCLATDLHDSANVVLINKFERGVTKRDYIDSVVIIFKKGVSPVYLSCSKKAVDMTGTFMITTYSMSVKYNRFLTPKHE